MTDVYYIRVQSTPRCIDCPQEGHSSTQNDSILHIDCSTPQRSYISESLYSGSVNGYDLFHLPEMKLVRITPRSKKTTITKAN